MSNLEERLRELYPDETLSESEVRDMTDSLKRFFTLCLTISKQEKSLQNVQGKQQNCVQNVNSMG